MKSIYIYFLATILIVSFQSCKKDSATSSTTWHVKYEVTCSNPVTKADITFMNQSGNYISVGDLLDLTKAQKLPWTYEADWSKDPGILFARALTLIVQTIPYNSTDVITLKIYVDGNVVIQGTAASLQYLLH